MKKTQKSVYYTTTESKDWVANSTFMDRMKKWGIEVVYIKLSLFTGTAFNSQGVLWGKA